MLPLTRSRNRARFFGIPFSPSALFEGGTVAGAWYDPSDLSTMFDTSAGTTPVAMPGLGAAVPVGLMLDKSQGLVLGAELATNADFATNVTGWTGSNATIAWSAGSMQVTDTVGVAGFSGYQAFNVTAGKLYRLETKGRVVSGTSTVFQIAFRTTANATTSAFLGGFSVTNPVTGVTYEGSAYYYATSTTTVYLHCRGFPSGSFPVIDFEFASVKEVAGNHAISFNNTTARPELRARVNLLTYSEEFQNAAWVNAGGRATIAANTNDTTDPLGGNTADKFTLTLLPVLPNITLVYQEPAITSVSSTFSVYAKYGSSQWVAVRLGNNYVWFDLLNGVKGTEQSGFVGTITPVVNSWYRITITGIPASNFVGVVMAVDADNSLASTTLGRFTYFWGADLRPANIGANVPAYQRIADANTYDTSGFPLYLRFDGIDDSMYTPASIPFATVTSDGQARRNLLSFPTVFNDPFWTVSGTTVSANSTTAPDGTTTADTLTETAAAGSHQIYNTSQLMGVPTPLCMSVYVKPNGRTWVFLGDDGGGVFFNLVGAGSVGTQQAGRTGSISSVGDGWYRVVVTGSRPAVNDSVYIALCSADNTLSYTGNGTSGVFIWGAQFEAGSTATAFQNIGTDKVAVFAGVRKLSDATGTIAELSASVSANNGAFACFAPQGTSVPGYFFRSKGTLTGTAEVLTGYAAPITNVFTGIGDISGDSALLRLNGTQVASDSANQGTGNFGTYSLFIGARNNSSFWFNGHLYSLVVAGSAVSAGNISATEQWVAQRTGIAIP